ncbi:MAG: HD domain-containing protein [Flavobacteriales bacterium]|nr:HD domain-containing protein [Flavobacteriales bacterium]
MAKRKILNDPVYGFVTFRHETLLKLVDHPMFQRLRRISQLGLSHLVYPGALHNRFQHAIGAMHLMQIAVDEIRHRGHEITEDEEVGLLAAILLHDIGHGPFSHALENSIVSGVHHEEISSFIMNLLNDELNGKLDTAISIYNNHYPKKYMHQLVSGQLDMDRLDYLARDSFFSGVVEGQVGSERILKMIDVVDDQLVIEEKGIYSIEKFIVARRFMYWQVYLHKTVLSAEFMLMNALKRAKELTRAGNPVFASPALTFFLEQDFNASDFLADNMVIQTFARLDDFDILGALKVWQDHNDPILSQLSERLVNRKLFKITIRKNEFDISTIEEKRNIASKNSGMSGSDLNYFFIHSQVDNHAYDPMIGSIRIKMKDGRILDAAEASGQLDVAVLSEKVTKCFVAWAED